MCRSICMLANRTALGNGLSVVEGARAPEDKTG